MMVCVLLQPVPVEFSENIARILEGLRVIYAGMFLCDRVRYCRSICRGNLCGCFCSSTPLL